MILVTAANGNQGKRLVPKLLAAGLPLRACVQSDASAARLRAMGVHDVVVGDISDPALMASAMQGIERVYHVGPTIHPREREIGLQMVDCARAAGVHHVVFSSVLHAITTDLVQHEIKRDIEEHLLSSGLAFTILQPANYMLPLKLKPVFERGVFELSWSLERLQSMVDLDDVAQVAATVLADPGKHDAATYELAAPGRYTAHDISAILSAVMGRDIPARQIDADTYLKAWIGERDPAGFAHEARVLRAISARYSSHDFLGNANVLTWLLGREPTSFQAFAQREYNAFMTARSNTGVPPDEQAR
jgi:uncharacterized protein YbjT (DUF2867 family)